ncbi:MAG: hypothetical protein PGN15_11940 [Aeromicrobium erythreum]
MRQRLLLVLVAGLVVGGAGGAAVASRMTSHHAWGDDVRVVPRSLLCTDDAGQLVPQRLLADAFVTEQDPDSVDLATKTSPPSPGYRITLTNDRLVRCQAEVVVENRGSRPFRLDYLDFAESAPGSGTGPWWATDVKAYAYEVVGDDVHAVSGEVVPPGDWTRVTLRFRQRPDLCTAAGVGGVRDSVVVSRGGSTHRLDLPFGFYEWSAEDIQPRGGCGSR